MDFLRSQYVILQERLGALTASQRMLVAAMVVICVMTLLYWGKFAGTKDRVPLMPAGAIAGDQLATVAANLKNRGIEATIENGTVMVSASQQIDAMSEVSFNGGVSSGATNALDAMLDKVPLYGTNAMFGARMNSAKQQYLAAIFSKWPGVRNADVVITESSAASITRRDPKLALNIQTKGGGADPRKLAGAAKTFAANCIAGLTPENISVIVDGIPGFAGGENDTSILSGDLLATKREAEADYLRKLQNQFSWIPGVRVTVNVEVDNSSQTIDSRDVDSKNKINEQLTSETKTQTPVGGAAGQSEPGAVPNMAVEIAAGGSSGHPAGLAIEENRNTNKVDYGTKVTQVKKPGGTFAVVGASVSVPQSFVVGVWRRKTNKADANAMPSEAELETVKGELFAAVKRDTMVATNIKDVSQVSVSDSWDLDPIVGGPVLAAAAPGGTAANLTTFAAGNAKEIMLGVLAVVSLFMVSRLVKKAEPLLATTPGLALAGMGGVTTGDAGLDSTADKRGFNKSMLIGGEAIAGEVGGGDANAAVMFGQELDPEALETSQMIDQVSSFVKSNPESAAQMINRWMSRD